MEQPGLWPHWPRVLFLFTFSAISPPVQSSGGPIVWSSGVWESSLSSVVKTEGKTMRRIEQLLTNALKDSSILNDYLTDWRSSGFDSMVPEDSDAHYLQLAKQRPLLKHPSGKSPGFLARVALSIQMASKRWNRLSDNKQGLPQDTSLRAGSREKREEGTGLLHPIDAYLAFKRIVMSYNMLSDRLHALTQQINDILANEDEYREGLVSDGLSLAGKRVALLHHQRATHLSAAALLHHLYATHPSAAALRRRLPDSDGSQTDDCADGNGTVRADGVEIDCAASNGTVRDDGVEIDCANGDKIDCAAAGSEEPWCLGPWDALELSRTAEFLGYQEQAKEWLHEARVLLTATPAESSGKASEHTLSMNQPLLLSHHETSDRHKETNPIGDLPQSVDASSHKGIIVQEKHLHCSERPLRSPEEESSLSCRLERLQSPYLLLMPLKLDELSLSPKIVLYRDFLSQGQIDYFIARAQSELEPSEVINGVDLEKRVSQTAWLGKDESYEDDPFDPHPELDEDDFLTKMNRQIEAATGLRVANNKASESYQVVHYQAGGYYLRHTDYHDEPGPNGHRQATILMYLTDVPAGGWTVFPLLKVGVQPVRGTALFWHNLDSRGEPNPLMQHAGCPVLSGNKWITTKWILSLEQFSTHPCPLTT